MKILYGYSNCTNKKYNEILNKKDQLVMHADQKYHSLLIDGLAQNGAEVHCVSGLPINRSVTKKLLIHDQDETENGVEYHYVNSINFPLFRQLCIFFASRRFVKKRCKKGEQNTFILCDCLNIANAYGMLRAAKRYRIPIIYIVTDIPEFQRDGWLKSFNNNYLAKADGYVLLTKQMNDKVNPNKKPYIVLEGHSDNSLQVISSKEKYEAIHGNKVVMYAGSIQRRYGIQYLVEGFIQANNPDSELRVYGDGDFREELEQLSEKYPNVRYMGIKSNQEIVAEEQKASLLVNPRPIAPEYTKYSFPSKNMEYMVSGTPMLTTKLPGMPGEYYPYVYLIEEETPQGIAEELKKIFAEPFEARKAKATKARAFVLEQKSNVVQAGKIIDFLAKEL